MLINVLWKKCRWSQVRLKWVPPNQSIQTNFHSKLSGPWGVMLVTHLCLKDTYFWDLSIQSQRPWIETHCLLVLSVNIRHPTQDLLYSSRHFPTQTTQTWRTAEKVNLKWVGWIIFVFYQSSRVGANQFTNVWRESVIGESTSEATFAHSQRWGPSFEWECVFCLGLGVSGGATRLSLVWASPAVWMNGVPHISNMLDCISQFTLTSTGVTKCLLSESKC